MSKLARRCNNCGKRLQKGRVCTSMAPAAYTMTHGSIGKENIWGYSTTSVPVEVCPECVGGKPDPWWLMLLLVFGFPVLMFGGIAVMAVALVAFNWIFRGIQPF